MAEHTPTPWQWIDTFVYGDPVTGPNKNSLVGPPLDPARKPYATDSSEHVLYCEEPLPSDANAEFIVRACNSHDALLEACKEAISFLNDRAASQDEYECLSRLATAIALAEGKEIASE